MRAPQFLPHRHWPSGRKETLGNSICPANQLHAGSSVSTLHPFTLVTALLVARPPPGLIAQERHSGLPCPPRLLRPGFQIAGSPHASAGYDYGAKLRIAPAGLSPASTAASLAAPCPGTSTACQADISGVVFAALTP